jgi:hypothetical protein
MASESCHFVETAGDFKNSKAQWWEAIKSVNAFDSSKSKIFWPKKLKNGDVSRNLFPSLLVNFQTEKWSCTC